MELKISIQLRSDVGCVRTNNEDMILLDGDFFRDGGMRDEILVSDSGRMAAAVADGMGGHNAGEVASETVLHLLDEFIVDLPEGLSPRDFRQEFDWWVERTHRKLLEMGRSNREMAKLGTTLVGLLTYENCVYVFNIGDSRLYRFRNGILRQLTTDHTMRQKTGNMNIPSNQIYNCLGGNGPTSFADLTDITDKVFEDDVFLVCSDGLSDMLSDNDIEDVLNKKVDIDDLIEAAKRSGGKDNVSAILLEILDIRKD